MDPNWLLSTSAQSAAAIVGIIGGFLVSRVLALSAERSSLSAKSKDTDAALKFKKAILKQVKKEIDAEEVDDFIGLITSELIETRGTLEFDSALILAPSVKLPRSELERYFREAAEATKKAYAFFEREHGFKAAPPEEMDEYLSEIGKQVPLEYRQIYSRVYRRVASGFKPRRTAFGALDEYNPMADFIETGLVNSQKSTQRRREYDDLRRELQWLSFQKTDIDAKLHEIGSPKGLWVGTLALLYFAASGIVVPIVWLPVSAASFTTTHKWIVVSLFISGLVAVLGYLVWSIGQLSGKTDPG